MNVKDLLRGVPIFQGLDDRELDYLCTQGFTQTYPKNTIFINEGDQSSNLFVILEGKAKVFVSDEEGKELILGLEKAGGCIGEIALLDNEPRSASVMTMERTRVLVFSAQTFHELILKNPSVGLGIIRGLTRRMRGLIDNVRNLALKNVYRRVVGVLMELSESVGEVRVIEGRLTHQDIADMIGASREMVSRIMKELSKGGYLETRGRRLCIVRTPPQGW